MAKWIEMHYTNSPWDKNPLKMGSFDYDRTLRFRKLARQGFENHPGSDAAGDSSKLIREECLLRTASGQWVFEHSVQRPPGDPEIHYSLWSDEDAVGWLSVFGMQNVVEHYFGAAEEIRLDYPPNIIPTASGEPIFFQPGADLISRIDAYATAKGFDRRYALYWLLIEALNAAEAADKCGNSDPSHGVRHPD
ncbi:hypothetical protein [Actinoplanes palleronii]|uniref:Uncharacterized protein n=1 Tax=Actinoplanes palleronii TaxID=113570 RepID=A0ABQ4BFV2_9ACTN|nr:hypothetical protein [Actinoplanes palleronii]GIE69559.1 hypothetical protein Apa02nite_056670 [Actinoplanes palleronii]